jgi:hypothetical protein
VNEKRGAAMESRPYKQEFRSEESDLSRSS